mmetsp:Transcript_14463/g.35907  ORF Transcript_14463/g.35907 Transcript_14463/m.35907 type:complete len:233 (+) Transcript_14463:974-1672(+)
MTTWWLCMAPTCRCLMESTCPTTQACCRRARVTGTAARGTTPTARLAQPMRTARAGGWRASAQHQGGWTTGRTVALRHKRRPPCRPLRLRLTAGSTATLRATSRAPSPRWTSWTGLRLASSLRTCPSSPRWTLLRCPLCPWPPCSRCGRPLGRGARRPALCRPPPHMPRPSSSTSSTSPSSRTHPTPAGRCWRLWASSCRSLGPRNTMRVAARRRPRSRALASCHHWTRCWA